MSVATRAIGPLLLPIFQAYILGLELHRPRSACSLEDIYEILNRPCGSKICCLRQTQCLLVPLFCELTEPAQEQNKVRSGDLSYLSTRQSSGVQAKPFR